MIPYRDIGPNEELFTYVNDESGEQLTWAITRLREYLIATDAQVFAIEVDPQHAAFIRTNRSIEQARLDRLTGLTLQEPLILATEFHGEDLMLDGHHRYVKLAEVGDRFARAYVVMADVWRQFLVDHPRYTRAADLMKRKSGL